MLSETDRTYLKRRETQSRQMAAAARDEYARRVHLELADLYALRLEESARVLEPA